MEKVREIIRKYEWDIAEKPTCSHTKFFTKYRGTYPTKYYCQKCGKCGHNDFEKTDFGRMCSTCFEEEDQLPRYCGIPNNEIYHFRPVKKPRGELRLYELKNLARDKGILGFTKYSSKNKSELKKIIDDVTSGATTVGEVNKKNVRTKRSKKTK